MVFKERAGDHPEAEAIRSSVFRGLAMPEKKKFKWEILKSVHQVSFRTAAGLYLGKALGYEVNLVRIYRVVARITQGLYWHHYDHNRLPHETSIMVRAEDSLKEDSENYIKLLKSKILEAINNNRVYSIGRDVLRYRFASSDREYGSAWLYEFFGDVRFIAFTGLKEDWDAMAAAFNSQL